MKPNIPLNCFKNGQIMIYLQQWYLSIKCVQHSAISFIGCSLIIHNVSLLHLCRRPESAKMLVAGRAKGHFGPTFCSPLHGLVSTFHLYSTYLRCQLYEQNIFFYIFSLICVSETCIHIWVLDTRSSTDFQVFSLNFIFKTLKKSNCSI